jgi:hypothetical protein
MNDTPKPIKVEFAPGCFDNFDGTQEELDALVAEITQLAQSGQLEELSTPVDDDAWEQLSDEEKEIISSALEHVSEGSTRKNLN